MLNRSKLIVIKLLAFGFLWLPMHSQCDDPQESELKLASSVTALSTYVFWRGAMSDGRKPYETALAELLIDLSTPEFGPAQMKVSDRKMTPARGHDKMKAGMEVHFSSAPRHLKAFNEDASYIFPENILNNLLGYRKLIVRTEDLEKFENLSSIDELRSLTAGQGRNWPDVEIYEHSQLDVLEVDGAPTVLPVLFSMLEAKRFDYLPLGIGEIEELYEGNRKKHPGLSIVNNLIIYYPFPVHIMVSRAKPDLAERVENALENGRKNGAIEHLFRQNFQTLIDSVDLPTTRVIAIPNPQLEAGSFTKPALLKHAQLLL